MENECEIAVSGFRQQRTWDAVSVTYTDYLLNRVVQALRPSTQEWQTRTAVIERLQSVLAGMPDFQPVPGRYGSNYSEDCLARVDVFGSFCSSLYHKGSDLDLTITGRWRDRHGHVLDMATMSSADTADMLHRIRRALISRRVAAADPLNPATVINARVPLVMYTDADSGVAVDISVCNHGGVFKSRFTREVMQFDDRFEALYRMIKLWAELRNLNDPKTGTLNSWSITQMVIFHLQSCKPAILPPLRLFFYNEPTYSPRPLEQPQQQQQARSSNGRSRQQQQQPSRSGAPYELLEVCGRQRQRYQPVYNSSSTSNGSSGSSSGQGLTELLVGFFVRFNEVFVQWLNFGRHREFKVCTWLGRWDRGDSCWRHEYLVGFEDPFDSNDNTARTLGTQTRNDGGCWRLADQLQLAVNTCTNITHLQDINTLLQKLFHTNAQQVLQQDYDPIADLLRHHQQHFGRQQQPLQWQQQQPQPVQPQPQPQSVQQQQQQQQQQPLGIPNGQIVTDLAQQMQQLALQQQQRHQQRQPPPGFGRPLYALPLEQQQPQLFQRLSQDGGLIQQQCQPQQQQLHASYARDHAVASSKDADSFDAALVQAKAIAEAALTSLRHRPQHAAAQPAAQLW